jgi:hypothetical protein
MKNYHRKVQKGIISFGENCKKRGVILNISQRKLFINHPTDRRINPIEYQPDVTFTTLDRGRKCTFQVISSQAKNKRQIEADIFRAFLCPEVSKLILIVPDSSKLKTVKNIHSIIQDTLLDYGIDRKMLPITIFIKIPYGIRGSKEVVGYLEDVDKKSKLFI